MEQNNLNKSNKVKIIVLTAILIFVAVSGLTYAYFSIQITGNDTASSINLTTANMSLVYTDVQILSDQGVMPGWTSSSKTLTVYNNGNKTVYYNIIWRDLLNGVINDELVLSATCSSDKSGSACPTINKPIPTRTTVSSNIRVKSNIEIAPGETHTYTVTVSFIETYSNQNYNQGKSFRGTLNISEGADEHPLYKVVKDLATAGTYAGTYSGNDTNDTYGETARKTVYYIKTSTANNATQANELINNKINVKFAGFCWQILRTTDTGGVKLIYNGEYVEGTGCYPQTDTEHTHKGIIGINGTPGDMTGNYMYSDTFTYNTTTEEFTLVNPTSSNWSTNKDLVGKYTCKNGDTPSTCTTLYYINTKYITIANYAWYTTYTIGDTQNAQIGTSPFNVNRYSLAYVGYMYGDTAYEYVGQTAPSGIMGNKVHWNGTNYELQESDDTTSSNSKYDTTHHYMCNNGSSTCDDGKVRYYYYGNYYTELTDGDDIEAAISKLLTNVENKHDSAMKAYLENWYYNNLRDYEDYIDQDAVYCNDRSINSLGGWSKTGPITADSNSNLKFNNYNTITTLGCTNNTDKFSTSNTSAQLKYPIGLATAPEMNLINNSNVRKTGQTNWLVSPRYFTSNAANGHYVDSIGSVAVNSVSNSYGGRPVVSLVPSNTPIRGEGTLSNPYVIE